MEIIIKSTDMVTTVDGALARLWVGTTAKGIACGVYVTRLAVHEAADAAEFEKELLTMPAPREVAYRETLDARLF